MSLFFSVVILAEDKMIQEKLADYDLKVQTFSDVHPIQVYPARVLSHIFAHLGILKLYYCVQSSITCKEVTFVLMTENSEKSRNKSITIYILCDAMKLADRRTYLPLEKQVPV